VQRWNETTRRSYSAVKVAEAAGSPLLRAPMESSWDVPVGGLGHQKVVIDRVKLIGGKKIVRSNEGRRKSILGQSAEKSGGIYPVEESVTHR
jgi:hypothetical protein